MTGPQEEERGWASGSNPTTPPAPFINHNEKQSNQLFEDVS